MSARDHRPFLALAALGVLVASAMLVPAARDRVDEAMLAPLRAQADPTPGLPHGYSLASLVGWALVGAVLGWLAYELVFVRARFEPDRAFFIALAPSLLLGPVLHAALVARLLPPGSVLAYMAAEPLVYLSVAAFAGVGLALGRITRRPVAVPLAWGGLALLPLAWLLAPTVDRDAGVQSIAILALTLIPATALAVAYVRWRPGEPFSAVLAVISAHALDGATTWMVLRDPFGLGFTGFGERNPVSETLVNLSTGWPYFALKLALPILLLGIVKREEAEARLRAFLLFAVFVLGFGPGMANLLQVIFG